MASKKTKLSSEVQDIVNSVIEKDKAEEKKKVKEFIDLCEITTGVTIWDIPADEEILFFDSNLSYELTGYKPITETKGLDFNPDWFTKSRDVKLLTGNYTEAPPRTKAYDDFWIEEYRRCRDGYTVNGYTITGDNYYFLNYYRLPRLDETSKAGGGRSTGFPKFYSKQYEYFHYLELCKRLRKNSVGLKGRGLGWSEIGASVTVNTYNCRPSTRCVITASIEKYAEATLNKCWLQLDYLNTETNGGFKKLRQKHNTAMWKRASVLKGTNETGWMSEIVGIVADKPNKIRGDRTDLLMYEEAGSWGGLIKAFIQGDALVGIIGSKFGIKLAWGTGGDSGASLEGLATIFYNPEAYDVLPCRHSYTANGESVMTAYFIPTYSIVDVPGIMDHRGVTDSKKGREFYQKNRDKKMGDPKGLLIYSAEYCFTPEEALALEGDNQFNSSLLAEQKSLIHIHKVDPPYGKIETGNLDYAYNGAHTKENITGFIWRQNSNGNIRILEHPIKADDGSPYRDLYVAGIDGIDLGGEDTSSATRNPSDFCLTIKKRQFGLSAPVYVCIYKDRPQKLEDAYITAMKLLQYYNCKAVLESTRTSILTYFRSKGVADKLLMKRPRACLADISNGRSNIFGAQATEVIIRHQLDLIARYIDDYYNELWFPEMLDELLTYSYENKGKFDIVASLGMCELGDEELEGLKIVASKPQNKSFGNVGYYYDEQGYKRFGKIPENNIKTNVANITNYGNNNYRTSDPRFM